MWRLLRAFMIVTGVVFVGTGALVGVAQLRPYDPLAPYQALMPGQSIDNLADYPCQLHVGMSNGVEVGFCQFEADDAVFGRVTVVTANRIITRLAFNVQDERLLTGDLVLCWGKPTESQPDTRETIPAIETLEWDNEVMASAQSDAYRTQLNYFRPLDYLSTEQAWQPCNSAQ